MTARPVISADKAPRVAIVPGRDSVADAAQPAKADKDFGFIPRGLRRPAAAYYVGISPATFDLWVAQGLMPQPKEKGGIVVWDRRALDEAFDTIPDRLGRPKNNPFKD